MTQLTCWLLLNYLYLKVWSYIRKSEESLPDTGDMGDPVMAITVTLVDTESVMVERLLSLRKPQMSQKLPRMPRLVLHIRPPTKRKRLSRLRPFMLPNRYYYLLKHLILIHVPFLMSHVHLHQRLLKAQAVVAAQQHQAAYAVQASQVLCL
jgi:hypothetical protein